MKTRVVSSKQITARSLRARDYVMQSYEVTYVEEIVKRKIVWLDADTVEQAWSQLNAISAVKLEGLLQRGTKTGAAFLRLSEVRNRK